MKQLTKENRLLAIVKDSNDAILLLDFEGNISAWNKGATRMYGYSEAKALTMNILDLVPAERHDETKLMLANLKEEEEEEEVTTKMTERLGKDGKVVPVWLTATIIIDDMGIPELITTTERDLSLLSKEAFLQLTGG